MNKNLTTLAARFSVLALAAAACAAQAGTLVINTDASDPAPKAAWEAMAARLVDAQAPGLAARQYQLHQL